ncbi:MAG: HAD family hydrolase [Actinomycetia bacterium]|nr:HAD family hydrolase [Actinomycetes bacterium]
MAVRQSWRSLPGRGVGGVIAGRHVRLMSPAFAADVGHVSELLAQRIGIAEEAGRTVLVLLDEGEARGSIAVADEVRNSAAGVMDGLRSAGIEHLVMLTGDNERTAAAVAAAGSDTAVETADVDLMRDDLSALPGFFDLGRRTLANIRQNVALSIAVKGVVLALAVLGKATLWMAVFADTGVALIVIANGLRLLRKR